MFSERKIVYKQNEKASEIANSFHYIVFAVNHIYFLGIAKDACDLRLILYYTI